MTIPATGAFTGSYDANLIASLFSSAYCLVSSPLLLESVDVGGGSVSLILRQQKTIQGLFEEYGERHFERAYRMSFASFCDLHTLLHDSLPVIRYCTQSQRWTSSNFYEDLVGSSNPLFREWFRLGHYAFPWNFEDRDL